MKTDPRIEAALAKARSVRAKAGDMTAEENGLYFNRAIRLIAIAKHRAKYRKIPR